MHVRTFVVRSYMSCSQMLRGVIIRTMKVMPRRFDVPVALYPGKIP